MSTNAENSTAEKSSIAEDLELKKKSSSSKQNQNKVYDSLAAMDETVDADEEEDGDLAVSMEADDPRLDSSQEQENQTTKESSGKAEQEKQQTAKFDSDDEPKGEKSQSEEEEEEEEEDSDDIDAQLDDLEQSVRGDDDEENDEDTDEDDGQARPDFSPFDRSLKKKASGSRIPASGSRGLGAHQDLKRPQLLDSDDDGIGSFDTQQQITVEDNDNTMEIEMEDTLESSRKSLTDIESGKKPEKSQNSTSPQKYQRSREGDIVERAARAYANDTRPRRLGKMYAFWYDKNNEPWIVVGPDIGFSLVEMGLVNGILGVILHTAQGSEMSGVFWFGLGILLLHDISFLMTILCNQGLPPRNPNIHSQGYLNKVKTIDTSKFCNICKVIARKDVYVEHCSYCNYCCEELDHHCPWSSKCIGQGNMGPFKFFIGCITACLIFAFVGGALVMGNNFTHSTVRRSQHSRQGTTGEAGESGHNLLR